MKPRHRAMRLALGALCVLAAALPAWADGTVSFKADVLPLLKAKPAFEKFLLGTLKIDDAGLGTRIADQAMSRLGGSRMGPYEFTATWHDANGADVPVTLIVQTNTRFSRQRRAGDPQRLAEAGGPAGRDLRFDSDRAAAVSGAWGVAWPHLHTSRLTVTPGWAWLAPAAAATTAPRAWRLRLC